MGQGRQQQAPACHAHGNSTRSFTLLALRTKKLCVAFYADFTRFPIYFADMCMRVKDSASLLGKCAIFY